MDSSSEIFIYLTLDGSAADKGQWISKGIPEYFKEIREVVCVEYGWIWTLLCAAFRCCDLRGKLVYSGGLAVHNCGGSSSDTIVRKKDSCEKFTLLLRDRSGNSRHAGI